MPTQQVRKKNHKHHRYWLLSAEVWNRAPRASVNVLYPYKAVLTQTAHEAVKWAQEDRMTLLSKPWSWFWRNNDARSGAQPEWPKVTWKVYYQTQYRDSLCSGIKKTFPQIILDSFWVQSRRYQKARLPQNEAKKVGSGFQASIPSDFGHVCVWWFYVKFYLNN